MRYGWLGLLTLLWGVGLPLAAEPVPLSPNRWQEVGFGVSLQPPFEAERVELPADGALAAWRFGDDASLRVRIVRSGQVIDRLETVAGQTWVGALVGLTQVVPVFVDANERSIGERPGLIQYADLEQQPSRLVAQDRLDELRGKRFFYGQAAMKLDPYVVAIFEVYAPHEEKEHAKGVLDAVVASVKVLPPPALYAMRKAQIKSAAEWLASLDRQQVWEQSPRQRWFRIVLDQEDVGYEQWVLVHRPEELRLLDVGFNESGAAIGVRTTILRDDVRLDYEREVYASSDGRLENWSYKNSARSRHGKPGGVFVPEAQVVSWSETGLRDTHNIDVIASIPPDVDTADWVKRSERFRGQANTNAVTDRRPQRQWRIPEALLYSQIDGEEALPPMSIYLSQLDLYTLPGRLPHDQLGVMAFYAYDADTSSMSLRTYEITPMPDGGFQVIERATAGSPPVVYRFNDTGGLIEIARPGGLRYLAATADDLRRIWPGQAP